MKCRMEVDSYLHCHDSRRWGGSTLSHCYFLITRLVLFNILLFCFIVSYVCFVLCIMCFCLVMIIISPLYLAVSLLFLYKFTDHCHPVETQLQ